MGSSCRLDRVGRIAVVFRAPYAELELPHVVGHGALALYFLPSRVMEEEAVLAAGS
jgi:hypothetical protein